MRRYENISACRACGCNRLDIVLDLGIQALTGVFPATPEEDALLTRGPLRLVRCGDDTCNLVQLDVTYNLEEMYGMNYGYRSGLNAGMVTHLQRLALETFLEADDRNKVKVVVDIGSNDGTLLNAMPTDAYRIGFDPTISKFGQYYHPDIIKVPDFFSASRFMAEFGTQLKADIVTSVAMFYDLPNPQEFVNDVASILAVDGHWVFEQSYVGSMVKNLAYDTVCHEHLEYYGVKQVRRLLANAGLAISRISFNDCNGGSFRVTAARDLEDPIVQTLVDLEEMALGKPQWSEFADRVKKHKANLRWTVAKLGAEGAVIGCGASTKGNVLLQYCGFTSKDIPYITEVNPDKFGKFTPGSLIPIVAERDPRTLGARVKMVLPWHFRQGFIKNRVMGDPQFLFPLPKIETA